MEVEREPTSGQRLAEIFRAVHTIKGNSGMLGYLKLGSVAHAGESLLGALREGKLEAKPPVISGLLEMVDAMRGLLGTIERTGGEGGDDYAAVVRAPGRFCEPGCACRAGHCERCVARRVFGQKCSATRRRHSGRRQTCSTGSWT